MATEAASAPPTLSDEEFFGIDLPGYKAEDGLDGTGPTGLPHELVIGELYAILREHVRRLGLGTVVLSNAVWRLSPGGRRLCPDIAFLGATRDETLGKRCRNVVEARPDLVVEVNSPSDKRRDGELREHANGKIEEYRRLGVPLLWVLDDATPAATVYYRGEEGVTLRGGDRLDGRDVVKGFSVVLEQLYK